MNWQIAIAGGALGFCLWLTGNTVRKSGYWVAMGGFFVGYFLGMHAGVSR